MKQDERIADINSTGDFNDTEVVVADDERPQTFASIEYYIIFHYTNEEYFYLSAEEINNLTKYADYIEETEKAFIYGFK